jgi:hypothetical protein
MRLSTGRKKSSVIKKNEGEWVIPSVTGVEFACELWTAACFSAGSLER